MTVDPPTALRPALEPDDEALVRRAQAGDEAAFATLLARHRARFRQVALRITGSAMAADDVLQEASLNLWRRLDTFRHDARFSTWSYRIVTNAALDHVRRDRRDPEQPTAEVPDAPVVLDASAQVIAAEELDELGVAMSTLSEEQRAALVLAELVGLPQEDIAVVLNTTVSGVKNRLYRARARLLKALGPDDAA